MASQKPNNKKPPSNNQAIEQEEVLQAVVILETYTNKFKPLSDDTPECLLPLLNRPLIDYTLQFLKEQGVEEIHLFCTQYYEKIKKHLNESKWSTMFRSDMIQLQSIPGCSTLNESVRQINMLFSTRSLARSHFILITAPSILAYNINLKEKFDLHKQRYKANKNAIMTVLCSKKSADLSLNFSNRENQTYLILNSDMVLLNYYNSYDPTEGSFSISSETMKHLNKLDGKTSSRLHLRTDLLDTQIYFCTAHVLNLFEDNFHAQSMTAFLDTIISDTIASNLIYCDILNRANGAYLATINSLNTYYFQTMKLLQRSREFNLGSNLDYKIDSLNVFLSRKMLALRRNVSFKRNVFVEGGVEIGEGCVLINCYIGKNCKLGSNVKISNCIVFDNCSIGDNISLNACLLGSNVKLGNNCRLIENILIGNYCDIRENSIFNNCGIYHVPKNDGSGFSDDENDDGDDESVDGSNYIKYQFAKNDNEDEGGETDSEHESLVIRKVDGFNRNEIYESLKQFYVWPIKKSIVIKSSLNSSKEDGCADQDDDDDDDDEFYEIDDNYEDESDSECELNGFNEGDSENDEDDNVSTNADHDEKQFELELIKSLKRPLIERSYDISNLLLEIKGLKAAHYQEYENVCFLTAKQLLELPINFKQELINYQELKTPSPTYLDLIQIVIERFKTLIVDYYRKNEESQYVLLNSVLDFYLKKLANENTFVRLLYKLNQDFELLDDNVIIGWHKYSLNTNSEEKKRLLRLEKVENFIKWLENDEDDEEEDEDDD